MRLDTSALLRCESRELDLGNVRTLEKFSSRFRKHFLCVAVVRNRRDSCQTRLSYLRSVNESGRAGVVISSSRTSVQHFIFIIKTSSRLPWFMILIDDWIFTRNWKITTALTLQGLRSAVAIKAACSKFERWKIDGNVPATSKHK